MGLYTGSIPNLINGVSQQPFALRLTSQCEKQDNGDSTVVGGLKRRPSTYHMFKHPDSNSLNENNMFFHHIQRDSSEHYHLVIDGNNNFYVVDLITGAKCTVTLPSDMSYFNSSNPKRDYSAITVADHTFLLNKSKVTRMKTTKSPALPNRALLTIKGAYPNQYYYVTLNDTAITPVDTGESATSAMTTQQAAAIYNALVAQFGTDDWNFSRNYSSVLISRKDGANFNIHVSDSRGGTTISLVKQTIEKYADLPKRAPRGFKAKILNSSTTEWDDYWVEFVAQNPGTGVGAFDEGYWKEVVAPNIPFEIDPKTMPHKLVRTGDNAFTLSPVTWGKRVVGDENTAPKPSFINNTIRRLFYHRNRLCFLSEESLCGSRAGEYYDFFVSTVTTALDSDPIDVPCTGDKVTLLDYAVPYNETVILFSDTSQYFLSSGETALTPSTANLKYLSGYEVITDTPPISVGNNIYYLTKTGQSSAMIEYFIDTEVGEAKTVNTTGHVPTYVPAAIAKLAASEVANIILLLPKDDSGSLYCYRYYWHDMNKLQSAWFRWLFRAPIKDIFVENVSLWLFIKRADGFYYELCKLDGSARDYGFEYENAMDRKINETKVSRSYDDATDTTTITLPFALDEDSVPIVITRDAQSPIAIKGSALQIRSHTDTQINVRGDFSTVPLYIGTAHTFLYRFSPQYIKERLQGGGEQALTAGRLQLLRLSVVYGDSGPFRIKVTPEFRPTSVHEYTASQVGVSIIGENLIQSGRFSCPVRARNDSVIIELEADSHFPTSFVSAEWEGLYTARAQRV